MGTVTAPSDLDAPSKALWKSAQKALDEQGTWQAHDTTTLTMMVRCHALVRALENEIADDWTVEGSRGQRVANPLIKALQEAMKQFVALARELKFTPATRDASANRKPPASDPFA